MSNLNLVEFEKFIASMDSDNIDKSIYFYELYVKANLSRLVVGAINSLYYDLHNAINNFKSGSFDFYLVDSCEVNIDIDRISHDIDLIGEVEDDIYYLRRSFYEYTNTLLMWSRNLIGLCDKFVIANYSTFANRFSNNNNSKNLIPDIVSITVDNLWNYFCLGLKVYYDKRCVNV